MVNWTDIPFAKKFFTNVQEVALTRASASLENLFINESGGQTRFPGLADFVSLQGASPTYLNEWQGDLVAVSNSKVYRIDRNGNVTDVTGVPVEGGKRVIFSSTANDLVMAAGARIVRLRGPLTEALSDEAPLATHVQFIDNYLVANELGLSAWQYCAPGDFGNWNALNAVLANSKPDAVRAILVTPFREVMVAGIDSIEQFERLASGDTPFFRRWASGEGVKAPYSMTFADNATWGVNKESEFVRISGQAPQPISGDVGRTLEGIPFDAWETAWAEPIFISGQKFIVLCIPDAPNVYETIGLTLLFDYRAGKWYTLYGWDNVKVLPAAWPGHSYYRMWDRHFVGGLGKVLELKEGTYTNDGQVQRMYGRTGVLSDWGEVTVDNFRLRIKRGLGDNDSAPVISVRAKRDNSKFTRWKEKSLGLSGDTEMFIEFGGMGTADTWQFEYEVRAQCEVEIVDMQAQLTPTG